MFAFDDAIHGYFSSKASDVTDPLRFGTFLYGTKGVIFLPNAIYPEGQPYILRSPAWFPGDGQRWERIEPKTDIPGKARIQAEII